VTDTGRGIDAAFLPHVFEMFRQEEQTASRTHGGLGVGLSIVRRLVELHGGTASASSAGPERGSTFTIRLPHQAAETRRAHPLHSEASVSTASISGARDS
jgi:signal transduction histidine kinase